MTPPASIAAADLARPPEGARAEASAAVGKVGPNAVLQVAAALRAAGGEAAARRVFAAAGLSALLETPPAAMIDQRVAARLHRALFAALPRAEAAELAADAGRRTADYLLAHRIPRPAQWLLRRLPSRLAARLLLRAVAANAWTFAGSGGFRFATRPTLSAEIAGNPLATPGCPWHAGTFERLFGALAAPGARVTHTACCAAGAPACRFEIDLPLPRVRAPGAPDLRRPA